ncbi:hypothetical protein HPG69_007376 [Diceros bicornis minor]|uniref:Aminotransferase class I/classII large domain-containing protein n=1 Tax=Diceros bicornis minor TaxID=77932 RepID=A0A7J7EKY9_DICBM|nr:hypothetical protein HPG69_007376 [Diceros bicornis minor]
MWSERGLWTKHCLGLHLGSQTLTGVGPLTDLEGLWIPKSECQALRLSRSDMNYTEDALLQYPDWRGQPFLREEVAQFLTYYCKSPARLDPENITDGNTHPFQLTVDKLEQALLEARLKGKKVRGLVLTNPQNPLGDVYSRRSLKKYLEFAKSLPDPNRTHVIWGTQWIHKVYLPTNRSWLQAAHRYITNKLKALTIPFLNRGSGLYVWINLKKYLDPCTFEEGLLHRCFLDNKLISSCGKTYLCKEPGWFRLVFADKPLRLKLGACGGEAGFDSEATGGYTEGMFALPEKESRAPSTCPGPASTQDLDSNYGDGLEREYSRKPDQKLLELYGVGDPTTRFSSNSSHLSSRGRVIKWFWDSAEEGYRTYHMDEYDEDKNPSGIINLGTSENKLCFDLLSRRVVVLNGCASLFSALATVLCEVGEAFLIPAPYYGAITQHVYLYGNVRLVCVYLDSEGLKVKGLILINPQNPLGDIYSPGELREFLEFAKRHELHVLVDEVYMLSVFEESVGYRSVLSLERLPDPQRTHVMWATSKDFGMSGLRFGTLYTENRDVATAVASLCRYHGLSGLVQYQMAQLLRDRDWINQVYLPENHARLKAAHAYVSGELRALGIPFLSRGAGFFIWVDLRKYLPEGTFEEEMRLWRRFLEHKVLLSSGKAFECKEPGWFRLVFSDEAHRLCLGMQRVRQVLEGKSQVAEDPPACQIQEPRDQHREYR